MRIVNVSALPMSAPVPEEKRHRTDLGTKVKSDATLIRVASGLIHHSDRGTQYAAEPYRLALARSGITPSMSRKGDCLDNAPMESFFHS